MKRRSFLVPFVALIALVGLVSGCATTGAEAPSPPATPTAEEAASRVVLGVRTPRHVKVALLTADQMLDGEGFQADQVTLVVCGPGVEALTKGSELGEEVARLQDRGVRIVVCGLTLEQLDIAADSLLSGVEVVPNGLTEIIRLQSEGYYSLEL